jgi:hypothetical protein
MSPIRSLFRSISKRRRTVIFVLLTSFVLLIFFLLNTVDLDLLLRFSDRVAILPTAQVVFRQNVERITNATNDELLVDKLADGPRLYREGLGCIGAQGSRTYGTNRLRADILADYSKAFAALGWKFGDDRVDTKTIGIIIVFVDSVSPDFAVGNGKYQTIYRVQVVFADPQIVGCFY